MSAAKATGLAAGFHELARRFRVPGAQLVVTDAGEPVVLDHGVTDHGTRQPVTAESKFPLGSVGKMFTATVVMMLVSDGDLDLDTPVGQYVPELRTAPDGIAASVTVRHLLSHTSGLASDLAAESAHAGSRLKYLRDGCRTGLMFAPGSIFSYSNVGYVLAGHLIEAVTGMTWWDAVETLLMRPLGITPSFVTAPAGVSGAPFVSGHVVGDQVRVIREQTLLPAEAPIGAVAASASDLAKLGALLIGDVGGWAQEFTFGEMLKPVGGAEPFGIADGWGLGAALYRAESVDWWGHDGSGDGTSCHLRGDPVNGVVVALTTNATAGYAMWKCLAEVLADAGVDMPVERAAGSKHAVLKHAAPPPSCAGRYVNGDTEYDVALGDDGLLYLQIAGERHSRLDCYEDLTFSVHDLVSGNPDYLGRFVRADGTGRIESVQVSGRTAVRVPGDAE
ncbi:hypothetical protein ALI144C_35460 [Actinosynnema sp. ALI-1.44]|uniref:serine hydrolase domain-containing protein n=1 Tax=Actinosynnema sp. ALI-1.44 TaxID=1933779 RepID=UPI00097C69C2|nr:serine hydrolase domain-containing protein [Actinosynnema sp. ALI-1.44]ONI76015.1 hypothetical protein ALI144C_35460 [Actinosynnema sp. ALI-1.44]